MPFREVIPKGYLSVVSYARWRRISVRTVFRKIASGKVKAMKVEWGWRWLIKK